MQPVLWPRAIVPTKQRRALDATDDGDETEAEEVIEMMPARLSQCPNTLFDLGDTGKCTHFPYLMFSILKLKSDHIIQKINLTSIFYFI